MRIQKAWVLILGFGIFALAGCAPPPPPPSSPGESRIQKQVNGMFVSPAGADGQIGFGCEFETPPNVVISAPNAIDPPVKYTYVSEVTKTGFTWKNNGSKEKSETDLHVKWTAEGNVVVK